MSPRVQTLDHPHYVEDTFLAVQRTTKSSRISLSVYIFSGQINT